MGGSWRRIERKDGRGRVIDFVEVTACAACGRGLDRGFDAYGEYGGRVFCAACVAPEAPGEREAVPALWRRRAMR
jgi:hypothetical protein